jgi:hypothetical protein
MAGAAGAEIGERRRSWIDFILLTVVTTKTSNNKIHNLCG